MYKFIRKIKPEIDEVRGKSTKKFIEKQALFKQYLSGEG